MTATSLANHDALLQVACDLIDDDTRRQRLRATLPHMPIEDAENIIAACRSSDKDASARAFQWALMRFTQLQGLRRVGFVLQGNKQPD